MKALTLLLALVLAWLAVASGYHLVDAPHFRGGGGPAPMPWIICFPSPFPTPPFAFAVIFLGAPALFLLAVLGRRQLRGGPGRAGGNGPGDQRDLWLAGRSACLALRLHSTGGEPSPPPSHRFVISFRDE